MELKNCSTLPSGFQKTAAGYTLIEVLIALAVLVILVGAGLTLYLTVLQSYNKAVIINELRQEGSRVMEEIGRMIRSADDLQEAGSTLVVTLNEESLEYQENGSCGTVTFSVELAGTGDNFNSRILRTLTNCADTPIGGGVITDHDRVRGVNVASLNFDVSQGGALRPDRVAVELNLTQGLEAPNREQYQGEVTLRNSFSTRSY